jgi:hypothetical protein
MKRLVPTPYDDLQPYLDVVYPKLVVACSYSLGRLRAEDVIEYIRTNHMQIWLAFEDDDLDGFIITQILEYPAAKELRFICLTGVRVEGWQEFMETIGGWIPYTKQVEDWAESIGCTISQVECPAPWEVYLKDYEYRRGHVLLQKKLSKRS